jgi:hypothetical protein
VLANVVCVYPLSTMQLSFVCTVYIRSPFKPCQRHCMSTWGYVYNYSLAMVQNVPGEEKDIYYTYLNCCVNFVHVNQGAWAFRLLVSTTNKAVVCNKGRRNAASGKRLYLIFST